jgi:hypothetical protein
VAGQCPWIRLDGFIIQMDGLPQGFYQVEVRAQDRAGNISNVLSRINVIDTTAPTLTLPPFTATLQAADSVGLRQYDRRLRFGGLTAPTGANTATIPVELPTAIGSLSLTNRVVTHTFNLMQAPPQIWRGIQDGVGGSIHPINGAGFGVFDLAWNFQEFYADYDPAALGANVGAYDALVTDGTAGGNPAGALGTFTLSSLQTPVSNAVGRQFGSLEWGTTFTGSSHWTSFLFSAAAEGTVAAGTGYRRPFHTVHFYRIDVPTGNVFYIGASTAPTVTFPDQDRARYDYRLSFNPAGLPAGDQRFFAVGVDRDGDAIRSNVTAASFLAGAYQTAR